MATAAEVQKWTNEANDAINRYAKGESNAEKIVKGAGGGALAGVSLGAALGTAFPGIGNVIGAAVGAVVGAIAGAIQQLLKLGPTPEQKRLAELHGKLQGELQTAIQSIPDNKARQWIANAILSQLKKVAAGQTPFCVSGGVDKGYEETWGGCALLDVEGLAKALNNVDKVVQEQLLKYAAAHQRVPTGVKVVAALAVVGLIGAIVYKVSERAEPRGKAA